MDSIISYIESNDDKSLYEIDLDNVLEDIDIDNNQFKDQFNKIKKYADDGNSLSQYILGYIYRYAKMYTYQYHCDIGRDWKKSFKYFKLSANQNNSYAQYELGFLYECDEIPNLEEAFKYYELSANQGNPHGQNSLGNMYREKKDYEKAFEYYILSVKQDNCKAQYNLGSMYQEDYPDLPKIIKKKIKLFLINEIKDKKKMLYYELSKKTIIILKQEIKIEKLKEENKELRLHIDLSPDGKLYLETKKHFEELINK